MKISKEQFDKLYSDNVLKWEYDEIIESIDQRFREVVSLVNKKLGWFVYGNYDDDSETDNGYFDVESNKEFIPVGGEGNFPEPFCFSDEGIGFIYTRWLWMDDNDILEEYKAEVEEAKLEKEKEKQIEKQKRQDKKAKKEEMKKIISSKLSKEELKYIKFK